MSVKIKVEEGKIEVDVNSRALNFNRGQGSIRVSPCYSLTSPYPRNSTVCTCHRNAPACWHLAGHSFLKLFREWQPLSLSPLLAMNLEIWLAGWGLQVTQCHLQGINLVPSAAPSSCFFKELTTDLWLGRDLSFCNSDGTNRSSRGKRPTGRPIDIPHPCRPREGHLCSQDKGHGCLLA